MICYIFYDITCHIYTFNSTQNVEYRTVYYYRILELSLTIYLFVKYLPHKLLLAFFSTEMF